MNDIVKNVLEHPFATCIVVGAALKGIASIICAARGVEVPCSNVYIGPMKPKDE